MTDTTISTSDTELVFKFLEWTGLKSEIENVVDEQASEPWGEKIPMMYMWEFFHPF